MSYPSTLDLVKGQEVKMAQANGETTLQQRLEIVERAQGGESDAKIAQALSYSMWTVRKWRRRERDLGRAGLTPQRGRPATGALGTASTEIREAIRTMRQANPGWGPETIRIELGKDERFKGQPIPSRPRLAAFLKQEGLTRRYEHHSELAQPPPTTATITHEEWELDAQGVVKVDGIGSVCLINISDLVSRVKVGGQVCADCTKPSTPDYQLACRLAFLRYGLPQRISLDHDSAFYDNKSASPFPSLFHLWLIALGIEVRFITHPPPQEHAVIERSHQVVYLQALQGQTYRDDVACQERVDLRLDFLNQAYPSRSLGRQAPLQAYPHARHSGRDYHPDQELEILSLERVHAYLAQHRWFRLVSEQGQFSLGAHRYGVGRSYTGQTIEITFDSPTECLHCLPERGDALPPMPILGLSSHELSGGWPPWHHLPSYQHRLPFDAQTWRDIMLQQAMTGTVL
jgi:transposase